MLKLYRDGCPPIKKGLRQQPRRVKRGNGGDVMECKKFNTQHFDIEIQQNHLEVAIEKRSLCMGEGARQVEAV